MLAKALHKNNAPLRTFDAEDLFQDAFLRTMIKLPGYRGESNLKTWACGVARNHLLDQARHLRHSPTPSGDAISLTANRRGHDESKSRELREGIKGLLGWLNKSPGGIEHGWEVLNLMLKTEGNLDYTATAMIFHTGESWTVERVRSVVRKIKVTPKGQALCEAMGIAVKDESKRSDRHGS